MKTISIFYEELEREFNNIIHYWKTFSIDEQRGGFLGQRDHYNIPVPDANKGIILNSRLLWSFSAIAHHTKDKTLNTYAERAYTYLCKYFKDEVYDGVYWELDARGTPVHKKKQTYAQAFALYGLTQYYIYTKDNEAKKWAIDLFNVMEIYALDKEKQGYIEAFSEKWIPLKDMRLSEKDQHGAKTMNTHLHILEAYTLLYTVYPDEKLKKALHNLISLFLNRFLNTEYNFELFFDEDWQLLSNSISFGHDIEGLWLLIEAAKALGDATLLEHTRAIAIPVADRFLEKGYSMGKGIVNEENRSTGRLDTDRYWWVHAEAMVGLYYAFTVSPKKKYLEALLDIWEFTKKHLIDRENGAWFFRIDEHYLPYKSEYKLGMWKSPYHNARACITLLRNNSL